MAGNPTSSMTPGIVSGQDPPFYEMDPILFQRLCRDIFDAESTVTTCNIYGVNGERQDGIDLIATRKNTDEIEVGQCKCHKDFPPQKIREVKNEFFKYWENHWSQHKVKRFILFVASGLDTRKRQDEILKQRQFFYQYGIEYEVWPAAKIRRKLQPHPGIVASYFHFSDHWVKEICGISTSISPLVENTATQTSVVITSVLENQVNQLSGQVSKETAERLKGMRKKWQEGHKSKVMRWLEDLRSCFKTIVSEEKGLKKRIHLSKFRLANHPETKGQR